MPPITYFALRNSLKTLLLSSITVCVACVSLGVTGCSQQSSLSSDNHAPSTKFVYHSESHSFLLAFLKHADSMHYKPRASFTVPAIWLFAPNGNLVSVTDDHSELPKLLQSFPPSLTKQIQNRPSLVAMNSVLNDATGKFVPLKGGSAQWTELLFTGDNPQCQHCKIFEKDARELQHAHASKLRLVTIWID